MNYELFYGVPAIAVGLSAISFSAALQKDAASIPNALAEIKTIKVSEFLKRLNFHRGDAFTKNF
jgi:hypothetical protein